MSDQQWHFRDLGDIGLVAWSFCTGSLSGLAYLLIFKRRRPTLHTIVGSFLGSGLVGIAAAVALKSFAPEYPGLWLTSSILLGLSGTHGIEFAIRFARSFANSAAKSWLSESKEEKSDDRDSE